METDRKELEGALRALKGAVSSRPGIPALTGVLIEGDGAGLATLTATDLETTATARIGAGDGQGFRALVPFKILADTVKTWTGERVGLERVDGHVKVAGASIRLLPEEDFPKILEPAELVGTFDALELAETIGAVAPAASGDEARPVLTAVALQCEDNGDAVMVATDSYRLHVGRLSNGAVRAGRYMIPARTLEYVAKRIGKRPAFSRVAIRCMGDGSAEAVDFELGTVRVTVRLIEGEFPNWQQLMPERPGETGATVHYDLAELAGALKAAGPFAVGTSPVRMVLDPVLGVALSASSPDLGDWSAKLERAEVRGESVGVAFTPAYLAGCLAAAGEGASLYVRDGLKPAHAVSSSGRVEALVMPVRPPVAVGPDYGSAANPYGGVPGVGVNAPHEPTADERAAGEPVEDGTDPGAAEGGEPASPTAEVCQHGNDAEACPFVPCYQPGQAEYERQHERAEPEPTDDPIETHPDAGEPEPVEHEVPAVYPGTEDDRRAIRKANDDEPESGNGVGAWSELAVIGDVDGVRVRLITGPDGGPWVDVRRFVASRRYNGPTKKGLAVRASVALVLADLLRDAVAASGTE